MSNFGFMQQFTLMEQIGSKKGNLLQKVQYIMAKEHGINASLRGWMNFFSGKKLSSEDDKFIVEHLIEEGYDVNGGWEKNEKFWNGILTKSEYNSLTSLAQQRIFESREHYNLRYWTDKDVETYLIKANNLMFNKDISAKEAVEEVLDKAMQNYPEKSEITTKERWVRAYQELEEVLMDEIEAVPMHEAASFITDDDYNNWVRVIKEEGKDRKIDLSNKEKFTDLAFEVLDNDSLFDMHPVSDKVKSQIVSKLWKICCREYNKR